VPYTLCDSIGKYFIQFGIKVYYNFLKYLLNIGKKKKRGFLSRQFTGKIKSFVTKYEADKNNKEKNELKIQKLIDKYYSIVCGKIIPHYNAFYTFYNNYSKSKENKGFVKTAICDYFVRIPAVNTNNDINEELKKELSVL